MSKYSVRTSIFIQLAVIFSLLIMAGCQFPSGYDNHLNTDPQTSSTNGSEVAVLWYSVHFTQPGSPEANSYRGGPGEALALAIREARISVDAAVYTFNLWEIRDALLDAQRRGLKVRMVIDSDNINGGEVNELIEAGIPVVGDHSESLMHNKFFILDRINVWTGSMNPTLGGTFYDNNNLISVRSTDLAQTYLNEFEEMFIDMTFSRGSMEKTANPTTMIDGSLVEAYFSPEDETAQRIIRLINSAQESVYFMAYSFTSDNIAEAMIGRVNSDVVVSGVMDRSQYKSNTGTEYERLVMNGVDVHLDGNPENMHNKVIIIDEAIVITGSYNFSSSAENKNDENVLIIHNPEIALIYLEEFRRVYNVASN